jgi:hypothetical protein
VALDRLDRSWRMQVRPRVDAIGHTLEGCACEDRDGRTSRSPSSFRPRC